MGCTLGWAVQPLLSLGFLICQRGLISLLPHKVIIRTKWRRDIKHWAEPGEGKHSIVKCVGKKMMMLMIFYHFYLDRIFTWKPVSHGLKHFKLWVSPCVCLPFITVPYLPSIFISSGFKSLAWITTELEPCHALLEGDKNASGNTRYLTLQNERVYSQVWSIRENHGKAFWRAGVWPKLKKRKKIEKFFFSTFTTLTTETPAILNCPTLQVSSQWR